MKKHIIKRKANFLIVPSNNSWSNMTGEEKQSLVRSLVRQAISNGKLSYQDIATHVYSLIKASSPDLNASRDYFLSANLWIWQDGSNNLGGVIGEELKNFYESQQGLEFKKKKELAQIEVQTAADDAARNKAVKDKQVIDQAESKSRTKTYLIIAGAVLLVVVGIYLYKKYAK